MDKGGMRSIDKAAVEHLVQHRYGSRLNSGLISYLIHQLRINSSNKSQIISNFSWIAGVDFS